MLNKHLFDSYSPKKYEHKGPWMYVKHVSYFNSYLNSAYGDDKHTNKIKPQMFIYIQKYNRPNG